MHESFLHYLWQMQYFDKRELRTTDGEGIEVFNPGFLNTNAGPDFFNARIGIGSIDWVGSVEIHTHASAWYDHRHEQDRAYDNVILHVVWQDDKIITRSDQTRIPTLQLKGRVNESLIKTYRQLVTSSFSVPCQRSLPKVNDITRLSMLEKALLDRLERKATEVRVLCHQNGNSWEETFYQLLARNFGFKINADPLFQLAKRLPLKVLLRHADQLEQVEALLLGQAGFLDGSRGDDYFQKLQREHHLLSKKYSLLENKMSKAQWRFLRLRPANFPTLRLAQLAALVHGRQNLFSGVIDSNDVRSLTELFTVPISDYWKNHYQFSKSSTNQAHELGMSSLENIIVNTVVPAWLAYGKLMDDQRFADRAVEVLQQLPAEENRITRVWKDLGMVAHTSFDSQSLIELYNNFCQKKNCLHCTIGAALMRPL
jgi:hypothetical protein